MTGEHAIRRPGQSGADIVRRRSGVELVSISSSDWDGFSRLVIELRWLTEPGWIELRFDQPAFLAMVDEVGGRCDLRTAPERGYDGVYVGAEHVTLVAAGDSIVIHAHEMRRATLICCELATDDGQGEDIQRAIAGARTRLMLKNRPLHACARLFASVAADAQDAFASAMARSVATAWAAAAGTMGQVPAPLLTGPALGSVLAFIRDELDASVASTELAKLAGLSPAQFGTRFGEATGLSLQAWQMDVRVRGAQRLMIDDPRGSLAEYSALCGFADQSHFTRAFLKVVGETPTEWLKRWK